MCVRDCVCVRVHVCWRRAGWSVFIRTVDMPELRSMGLKGILLELFLLNMVSVELLSFLRLYLSNRQLCLVTKLLAGEFVSPLCGA